MSIIENAETEKTSLEFKEILNISSDAEKGELLADLSSFANANWWDIIYGIREESGIATEIVPMSIPLADIDAFKLKINSIVSAGIEPRIDFDILEIAVPENPNQYVFLIRVKQSWLPPHRVIFTNAGKPKWQFYMRTWINKIPMDITDLRKAFLFSETISQKAQKFKQSRIKALSFNFPAWMLVLHIMPLRSFSDTPPTNFKTITEKLATSQEMILPIRSKVKDAQINFEWLKYYSSSNTNFIQFYRNGIIESVSSKWILPKENIPYIPHISFESEIIKAVSLYTRFLQSIEVECPLLISTTMIWFNGCRMEEDIFGDSFNGIEHQVLELPNILLESYGTSVDSLLHPTFDMIWNACWHSHSTNFDVNWNWVK